MKDAILEILLDKIKATTHDFYPTGIEGLPQSSREIAEMMKEFIEWYKNEETYNVIMDDIVMIAVVSLINNTTSNSMEGYFTFDELFTYWKENIKKQ